MSQLHEVADPALVLSAQPGQQSPPGVSLDSCFHLVSQVEEQVRFADSKAAFLATIHTLLVGPLVYNLVLLRTAIHEWAPESRNTVVILASVYGLLFLSAMALVALAVLPRFRRKGRPASRLFFGQIAREYGNEPERFVAQLSKLSDKDWVEELGVYIVDASRIAAAKHLNVRRATYLTVTSVVIWCAVVLALLGLKGFNHRPANPTPAEVQQSA